MPPMAKTAASGFKKTTKVKFSTRKVVKKYRALKKGRRA